jgi:prepilin signal peptidase PulO-like enzyme (type II secretory pathway)
VSARYPLTELATAGVFLLIYAQYGVTLQGVLLALHYGYKWLRKKDGLGFGDVKFLAVAGLWLGVMPMVPFLFYAGVLGIITGLVWRALGLGPVFPFGPSLAVALFICVAYPEAGNLFLHVAEQLK